MFMLKKTIDKNKRVNTRVNARTESFWLRDIAYCERCGSKMSSAFDPYRKGKHMRYYGCTLKRASAKMLEANRRERCTLPHINADDLEALVWGRLMMLLRHPYHRSRSIEQAADLSG